MRDLTRTPTLSPRGSYEEIKRWVDTVAVRGNFDWMPGILYTRTPLEALPFSVPATWANIMSITFTPRVKCRVAATACVDIDATDVGNLVLVAIGCSPAPLTSSGTDTTAATTNDAAREAPITGGFRHSVSITNSIDLAAGVTYTITAKVKAAAGSTARVNTGNSLTLIHVPLLTPAGQ